MAHSSEIINWSDALESVNGDRELLIEVVQVLVDDLERLQDGIAEAVEGADAEGLRRAGHTMKGSLRFLGNTEAQQLAQRLEEMGAQRQLAEVASVWTSLQSEIERLRPCLKQFCAV